MSSRENNNKNEVASDPSENILMDLFETDPNMVKAELDFFSTPHTYEYRDLAYGAIKNIQETCTYDFKSYCTSQSKKSLQSKKTSNTGRVNGNVLEFEPVDEQIVFIESNDLPPEFQMINSIFSQFAFGGPSFSASVIGDPFVFEIVEGRRRRRLQEDKKVAEVKPKSILNSIVSAVVKPVVENVVSAVMKAAAPQSSPQSMAGSRMGIRPIAGKQADDRDMNGAPRVHHGGVIAGREPKPMTLDNRQRVPFTLRDPVRESLHRIRKPSAPVPATDGKRSLRESHGKGHGKGDERRPPEEEEDSEDEQEGCDGQEEDNYFTGYLGFGATNDYCLYQNYDKLSQPCQESIQDLYTLRQQYWGEEQEISGSGSGASHEGGGFILFVIFLMFLVILRSFRRLNNMKRRKDINAILKAVDANPHLKAAVEQAAGVEMPRMTKLDFKERALKAFKIIGIVVLAGATTFATLALSEFLAHVVVEDDHAAGAFGLIMAWIIIAIFSVSVKRMRNSDSPAPRGPERFVAWVTQRFTNFRRGRSPRGAGEAYYPLAGDESGADAEMTPVHTSNSALLNPQSITVFSVNGGGNGQHPQIFTGVPVSARPVSGSTYI